MPPLGQSTDKILVLVVDRDDDLGTKTGVPTPVIGRAANIDAAVKLILADPEEADANSMFAAVKLADQMKKDMNDAEVEVATVTGSQGEGLEADLKVANELRKVLSYFPAERCVFVSDGETDAVMTPIVASLVSIASVRRVVVRQSQTVEQTWMLLGRYVRLALTDPRYARIFLGIPGLLVAVIGLLSALGWANVPVILLSLGLIMLFRGLGVDRAFHRGISGLSQLSQLGPFAQMRLFASVAAVAVSIVALLFGVQAASSKLASLNPTEEQLHDPSYVLSVAPRLAGAFLTVSIDLIAVSALLGVTSNLLYYFLQRHPRFWRSIQAGVVSIWLWALLKRAGGLLESEAVPPPTDPAVFLFLFTGIMGVITLGVTFALTRTLRRIYAKQFRRPRAVG